MDNIFELIKKRRSVFPEQYNGKPIEKETIEKILEAANWAPTHKRTEPWRFKVVQGEAKTRLGKFLSEKYLEIAQKPSAFKQQKILQKCEQSDCIVLICMQRDPKESLPEWEEIAATSMAVQNMWLAATTLNIGSYWSSPGMIEHMHEFTKLNQGEKCLGLFYMGNFDGELPEGERKSSVEAKTEWIR